MNFLNKVQASMKNLIYRIWVVTKNYLNEIDLKLYWGVMVKRSKVNKKDGWENNSMETKNGVKVVIYHFSVDERKNLFILDLNSIAENLANVNYPIIVTVEEDFRIKVLVKKVKVSKVTNDALNNSEIKICFYQVVKEIQDLFY